MPITSLRFGPPDMPRGIMQRLSLPFGVLLELVVRPASLISLVSLLKFSLWEVGRLADIILASRSSKSDDLH